MGNEKVFEEDYTEEEWIKKLEHTEPRPQIPSPLARWTKENEKKVGKKFGGFEKRHYFCSVKLGNGGDESKWRDSSAG